MAVVRLLRIEEGGAYADVLSGEGEKSWEDEMAYLGRTLGFCTSELDLRGRRLVKLGLSFPCIVSVILYPIQSCSMNTTSAKFLCVQVTDEVAGVVRWKRYLDFLILSFFKRDLQDYERMEPLLRQVCLLSLFQLVDLSAFFTSAHGSVIFVLLSKGVS